MPRVEVLANTAAHVTPGYALVPDTRGLPQIAAQPVAGRKRAARNAGLSGGDTTVRQQNAVLKHLADLDKDSLRDVQIPIPSKQKEGAGRALTRKMTPNARRILMSQKTFANHLADEEAALAQQAQIAPTIANAPLKRSSAVPNESVAVAAEMAQADDPAANEPLLEAYVPEAPSAEVIDALTTAPPLSYNASRATLTEPTKPQRHFCEICGYWGTIKCLKCGARVCGLECKGAHDDGRCLKFYA